MKSIDKIYMIGAGAVWTGLMEIFNKEKLYRDCIFVVIEPKKKGDVIKEFMNGRNYTFVNVAMTRQNCARLLKDCDEKTFVINLSVDVDSIMILKEVKKRNAFYIDTSLEMYEDHTEDIPIENITEYKEFEKNNLYHQNELAFKVMKGSRKTRVISGGMNPFLINQFAKKGLRLYAKSQGKSVVKGNYGKCAYDLGLKKILVVEYDSQKFKVKATPELGVSDWSYRGLESEALDLVMVSLNNDAKKRLEKDGVKLIKPTEGDPDTHVRFINTRGMDSMTESIALDYNGKPFNFSGYNLPHAEIITMSSFFKYRGDAPTIFYVYRMADEAIRSLDFVRENAYKPLKNEYVVMGKDILPMGFDSIGALLEFENGDKFWGGTILSIEDTRKMGFKSGPTVIQVAASVNATIKWQLENSMKGLNNAETISHKFIFKHAKKYLGKIYFKKIN